MRGSSPRMTEQSCASLKPIIQRSVRPLSKLAFKAALAAQPGQIPCPRSGNDKPCRLDPAVLDDFRTLKHEGTYASVQFSAESLHADEARGSIVAQDLQSPNWCHALDISGEC